MARALTGQHGAPQLAHVAALCSLSLAQLCLAFGAPHFKINKD